MDGVFNAELGGNKWRAIKIFEGDQVNASGLKKLLLGAVALNATKGKAKGQAEGEAGRREGKDGQGSREDVEGRPDRGEGKTRGQRFRSKR